MDTLAVNFMEVLQILGDPNQHPNIEDEELYTFLNQMFVTYKEYKIFASSQEAAVCAAIKKRYQNVTPPPKTKDLVNMLDQQRASEEDKKASTVDLFRRAGPNGTSSVDAVKEIYRRKGVASGNVPLTETDIMPVLKFMASGASGYADLDPSNAENFGKATAQMVQTNTLLQVFWCANS